MNRHTPSRAPARGVLTGIQEGMVELLKKFYGRGLIPAKSGFRRATHATKQRPRSGGCVHLSREAGFRCGDVVRAFSSRLCPQPVHDPTTPPRRDARGASSVTPLASEAPALI